MKAWGLFLSLVLLCAGCAMPPEPGPQLDRYGGPPLQDPANFDRAGILPLDARSSPAGVPA